MSAAFVVGYSGVSGRKLVEELIAKKRFNRLVLIGRRPPSYLSQLKLPTDCGVVVEIRQIDFSKLDEYEDEFAGFEQGFCCLGSSYFEQGCGGYLKVDYYATIRIATMAKRGGCRHFHVITVLSPRKNCCLPYYATKLIVEDDLARVGFNRLTIYRPGHILADRGDGRLMEISLKWLLWPFSAFWPTFCTIPLEFLIEAMCACSLLPTDEKSAIVSIITNPELFQLAKQGATNK